MFSKLCPSNGQRQDVCNFFIFRTLSFCQPESATGSGSTTGLSTSSRNPQAALTQHAKNNAKSRTHNYNYDRKNNRNPLLQVVLFSFFETE